MIDEAGLKYSQGQMSIYYKYTTYGSKLVVLSYVDELLYWYTYEELGKWFVDTLGNIFHMKLLEYAHWFMSSSISQLKYHYISVDQSMYATSVVAKYLYTDTKKMEYIS